jgi:hypothetical protein
VNNFFAKYLVYGILFCSVLISRGQEGQYRAGFINKIKGQDLEYHSPHADVGLSLLVRSGDSSAYIVWNAEPLPSTYDKEYAEYIMMAGIDVNPGDKHTFRVYVNDELCFLLANPDDTLQNPVVESFKKDIDLDFEKLLVDKYGDLMGYMVLRLPAAKLHGKPVQIKVKGEHAGSMSWFMVFQEPIRPACKVIEEQAIIREGNGEYQQLRLDIVHLNDPAVASIRAGDQVTEARLKKGYNIVRFKIPRVEEVQHLPVEVAIPGQVLYGLSTRIMPVMPRTIHLIHHSHVDIGYTHVQEEVLEKQWQWLEMAIDLSAESVDYPPEAHFKWNVEVMWAVDQYLRQKPEAQQEALMEAIGKGWIELDAFYGNNLMALSNGEELIRMTASARDVAKRSGVDLEAAMISDIPGWSWGMVPVLAQSGVKYLSLGTNQGHRIGHTIREWGDKPFYWVSPSGKERVLTWIHGKGYSLFHTGLGYENLNRDLAETNILEYIQQLHNLQYPYDIVPLRYNIGSDNGPPDKLLSKFVMKWNEKYVTPRLVISTVSEAFGDFEKRYGDSLPEIRGDFTAFWEDGAISSARETAINQRNAERLVQAEKLYSLINPNAYPADLFDECWRNVLLFNEHTWGSWNSISEPESEFTLHQWQVKKKFCQQADSLSKRLLEGAFEGKIPRDAIPGILEVYNTCSWRVSGPIYIGNFDIPDGHIMEDENGEKVAWQKLKNGDLAFIARDVPALGSKVFTVKPGEFNPASELQAFDNSAENEYFKLVFDKENGNIIELFDKRKGRELVNVNECGGLNSYWYVEGRDPANRLSTVNCQLSIDEMGPVLVRMSVKSEPEGCNSLLSEITLYEGLDYIEISNTIDKIKTYNPEAVHFAFPLEIEEPQVTVDLAFGHYRPETDQIKGSNKNFFTAERYLDVSNESYGVTIVSPDAPILEVGEIMSDPIVYGWMEHAGNSALVFSYAMNNYWETNYLAAQEGAAELEYVLRPHEAFDPAEAERFAVSICQPLVAAPAEQGIRPLPSFLRTSDRDVLITSLMPLRENGQYAIRLFNSSNAGKSVRLLHKGQILETGLYFSNLDLKRLKRVNGEITMEPLEWITLLIEPYDAPEN